MCCHLAAVSELRPQSRAELNAKRSRTEPSRAALRIVQAHGAGADLTSPLPPRPARLRASTADDQLLGFKTCSRRSEFYSSITNELSNMTYSIRNERCESTASDKHHLQSTSNEFISNVKNPSRRLMHKQTEAPPWRLQPQAGPP